MRTENFISMRRRMDTSEMGSHLIDLVSGLLWSHLDEVIIKYKLFRRLRGISLLTQSYRRDISSTTKGRGGGIKP